MELECSDCDSCVDDRYKEQYGSLVSPMNEYAHYVMLSRIHQFLYALQIYSISTIDKMVLGLGGKQMSTLEFHHLEHHVLLEFPQTSKTT